MQKKVLKKYENIKNLSSISSKNIVNIIFTIFSRLLLFFSKNILKTPLGKQSCYTIIIFYILYLMLLYKFEQNNISKLFPYENRITLIY